MVGIRKRNLKWADIDMAEVEAEATLEGCRVEIQEAGWLDKHCPECNPRLVKPS